MLKSPSECYNQLMQKHFLQSKAWEKYEQLEGHQTLYLDNNDYSVLAILKSTPVGNYLFCPYGPYLQDHNSLPRVLDDLKTLAHEQKAFFIRIEPTFPLDPTYAKELNLHKSHDIDPAHTWTIDLTQDESDISKAIEKNKLRHWRIHEKKGVSFRTTKDPDSITILSNLLNNLGKRNKFTPQDEAHLKNQLKSGFATLYVAEFDHQPIAAALVYDHDKVRYYAHAATDSAHRKLMAGTSLLVQIIVDAKKAGCKIFDFWGITTSNDPSHPWYGFTQYKKSFGGQQVDYAGTYDLPLNPARYKLYQFLRKINRLKRHN